MATQKRGAQPTEKPVPEELGGLSEDTIREIMNELPDEDEYSGETAPETQPDDEEVEVSLEEEPEDEEPEDEQVETKKETTVPYDALHKERQLRKEERQKKEAATKQLEEQDRLIKELQQRLVALEQKPADVQEPEEPEDEEQGSVYHDQLFEEAEKAFERRYGRSPDELSGRDMVILNRIAGDIDMTVKNQYSRQIAEVQERQKIYSDFAKEITAKPDFQGVVEFVTKRVNDLPPISKDYLMAAYQRAEAGKGSLEDVIAVRNFWEASEALYRLGKAPKPEETVKPATTTSAKKMAEKIDKMAAHPKSASIPATGTSGGALSVAELERLLTSEDWDKIPPEVQRLLKGG